MARMENQGALEGTLVFMQRTYCLWGCLLEKNNPRLFPQAVTVSHPRTPRARHGHSLMHTAAHAEWTVLLSRTE